jgi:DtxR family Mn-dependent transcriptional regulator
MSDLIDTGEMYLRTIFELEEERVPPLRARIAERLQQSGPTVSQTVARMERDGLLAVRPDRSLQLTETGWALATRVMRKHRLAECMLVEVIGLPWEDVHEEACRWEHVMSDEVERRLLTLLGHPTVSPFGNPIPGLSELGEDSAEPVSWQPLARAVGGGIDTLTVLRLGEHVQHQTATLSALAAAGIRPGSTIQVERVDNGVLVVGPSGRLEIPIAVAELIMVKTG